MTREGQFSYSLYFLQNRKKRLRYSAALDMGVIAKINSSPNTKLSVPFSFVVLYVCFLILLMFYEEKRHNQAVGLLFCFPLLIPETHLLFLFQCCSAKNDLQSYSPCARLALFRFPTSKPKSMITLMGNYLNNINNNINPVHLSTWSEALGNVHNTVH